MKLKSLQLENITSLRGIHFLDFDKALQGESLFAITGPTGAGKSSLLSAISLALFGRTYKKSLNTTDYISSGARQGTIELTFEHAGSLYQANWSLKIARNDGSLIKNPIPKRHLLKNGEIHDKRPEEILGLNFDQFCRSAILNQGEFSRFLYSSFAERREILEELVENFKLSLLAPTLNQTIKEYRHQQEIILSKLDGLGIEELEQLPHLRLQIEHLVKTQEKTESLEQSMLKTHKTLQNLTAAIETKKQKTARLQIYQRQLAELSPQEILLREEVKRKKELCQDLDSQKEILIPILQKKQMTWQALEALEREISYRKLEITSLEQKFGRNRRMEQELQHKIEGLEKKLAVLDLKNGEILRSKEKQLRLSNLINERRELFSRMELLIGRQQALSENTEKMMARRKEISLELGQLKLDHALTTPEETEQILRADKERFASSLKSLLAFKQKYLGQLPKYKMLAKTLDLAKHDLNYLTQSWQQGQEKIQLNEEKAKALHLQKTYFRLLLDSQKNKECSLCHRPWEQNHQHEQHFKDESAEMAQLTDKILQVDKLSLQLMAEQTNFNQLIRKKSDEIQQLEWERKSLGQEIIASMNPKTPQEAMILEQLLANEASPTPEAQKSLLSSLESSIDELEHLVAQKDREYEDFLKASRRSTVLQGAQEQNQIQLDDALREAVALDLQREDLSAKDKVLQEQVLSLVPDYPMSAQNQLQRFTQDTQCLLEMEKFEIQLQELKQQIEGLSKNQALDKKALQDKTAGLTELEESHRLQRLDYEGQGNKEELENQLTQITQSMEREKLQLSNLTARLEKSVRESERIQTSLNLTLEQERECELMVLDYLSELAEGSESSDLSSETTLELESFRELKNQCTQILLAMARFQQLDFDQLVNSPSEFLGFITSEQLPEIIRKIKTLRNAYFEELGTLRSRETELSQKENEIQRNRTLFEKLQNRLNRLQKLEEVLGKNDFRNWVLSHLEKQLIMLANKEISNLCEGRYKLIQRNGKFGPEFFIIDHWQNAGSSEASERKISTLSGGETFLISLGLSLGLAELISHNNQADFFLIDEGFGSLDPAGLSEALEVLWQLQARGKQIGIISHVQELNQNIPVNFNLKKDAAGNSTISLQYN